MATHATSLPARGDLLRRVFQANAATSLISGAALVAAAGPIAALAGIPSPLTLVVVGSLLLLFGALCWRTAARQPLNRTAAWSIVAIDFAWVLASVELLLSGLLPLTATGWWLVVDQAVLVLAFAEVQLWLLWKSR